ncbi:MAG TPA: AMP-binding protein [Candidatus Limnocylindria bacterium]
MTGRLVWIDWLKIIVVFAVFVYHAAEPFLVINWLVSNNERSVALSAVAGFGFLFGLPLLFLLAGATAWLSLGQRSLRAYGLVRVQRLLIPLVLGILLLTPLQWWLVAAIDRGGENPLTTIQWFFSGIHFDLTPRWFGDYGLHLWFIAFLLAYSLLSLPLLAALRRSSGVRLLRGLAQVPTPVLLLALFMPILASQWLLRIPAPTYRDWADFALWLGFFAVGVILIAERSLLDTVVRNGPRLAAIGVAVLLLAVGAVAAALATGLVPAGQAPALQGLELAPVLDAPSIGYITVRTAAAGALVAAALWLGVRWLRWQPAWLPRVNRAVLPFYVLHHPVSVAVAAVVVQWRLGLWPKLGVILVVSLAGSLALTEVVMRSRLGRALFGIPNDTGPRDRRTPSRAAPGPANPFAVHAGDPLTVPEADQPRSLVGALQATVRQRPDGEALRWKDQGRWIGMTYAELWNRIRATSLALQQRGVRAGDHVVILARSRPEWVVADFAAMALGAVVCPIYPGESDARIEQIARGLRPRLLFVEDARQHLRFGDIAPTALLGIPTEGVRGPVTLVELQRAGDGLDPEQRDVWQARVDGLDRSAPATIVQTIDEEGVSRGAILTHGNVLHSLYAGRDALPLHRGDVLLSVLPLSHMFERAAVLMLLSIGGTIAFAEPRIDRWADNMREVRPHTMGVVPLFLTHMVKGMRGGSVARPGLIGGLARWSLAAGSAARGTSGRAGHRRWWLRLAVADALVLRRLRAATGGRLRFFCCGGAPLPVEVGEFLAAAGIPVIEGYGMTEASPVLTMNRLGRQQPGTVGPPIAGTELRIDAETGEILARGPQVMQGYHGLPRQTSATLTAHGWLRTGDLGSWDEAGNLRITGVCKDLLILATGKKVSPRPLEAELEGSDLIARAAVVDLGGEGVGVLVWPDGDSIRLRAALDGETERELLTGEVRRLLGGHAPYERPRRLGILPRDLNIEAGELTADGRPNRATIVANWASSAAIPLSWRVRETPQVSVLPSPLGAVSSAG